MKIIAQRPLTQALKDRMEWMDFLHDRHCKGGRKCKYDKKMQCEWIEYDVQFEEFMSSREKTN